MRSKVINTLIPLILGVALAVPAALLADTRPDPGGKEGARYVVVFVDKDGNVTISDRPLTRWEAEELCRKYEASGLGKCKVVEAPTTGD